MERFQKYLTTVLVFLCSIYIFSQDKEEIIQQRIEFISEQLESESIDLTNVLEILTYRFDKPLNLNNCSKEDLQELNLLTDVQINDLLLHRELYGKLISIYELQSLTYWGLNTIQLLRPFIKVDDKLDQLHVGLKDAIKNGKFEIFLRYQRVPEFKNGFEDVSDSLQENSNSYYYGNPDRYYTRFRYSYRTNLSIGLTAEKDPGEEFFQGTQKNGFDFYSAHAFFKGGKYLKVAALGDYQVQIGQGLNFWSGYAFGKTADVTNVKRTAQSLRPYTSVDETRFLRGAGVEVGYGKFSLMGFGSYKGIDASVITDTLLEEQEFASSINLTGLHRTNSELARKNTLQEIIGGANLRYDTRTLDVGVASVYQRYDNPYNKETVPYNQFDFRGKDNISTSLDYAWVIRNFNFFGEVAHSSYDNGWAQLHGVLFSLDRRASMSIIYRDYQRNYQTFYNNGFSEGSRTQNERGLYTALKFNLTKKWSINTYADVFSFPWLKYLVEAPSEGHELFIQPTYKPNRELEIYARFREQKRQRNSRFNDGTVTSIEDVIQRNYRFNFSYKITEGIRLKTRLEYVTVDRESVGLESGIIFTQDLIYRPKSSPLDLSLRYALFDTDSYDTRIYTYESNALYVFSVPAYYYKGSRAYALIRYTFLRKVDVWVKYGRNIYANRSSLGSGSEMINQNTRSDITVQLRFKI